MDRMSYLEGVAALPRQPGAPIFQAPWEARVFALVVRLRESGEFAWDEFRDRLIAEITAAEAADPDGASGGHYFERWLASFEKLLADKGILMPDALAAKVAELASGDVGT